MDRNTSRAAAGVIALKILLRLKDGALFPRIRVIRMKLLQNNPARHHNM
jgi:hypothetical protein